jgi:hypothetical protein
MKQTFLLQEVIDDLVNTDKSLSASLMKLNYFGRLIKNQELIDYTQNELNGYRGKDSVPSYRKTTATLYIDFQAGYNLHNDKQLPVSMIAEPYRQVFEYIQIREGIAAVEKLARETEKGASAGQIFSPLPMEMLHILQEPGRKLYKSDVRIGVVGARLAGNASIVVEIPNAIRTKLLEFVMSIADAFGYDIEIESFNKKADINNQTIIHQMNTTINNSGDGNLINTGNEANISATINIKKGDFDSLEKKLLEEGIDKQDVEELKTIFTQEEPDRENHKLGPKVNGWIGRTFGKILGGTTKIAMSAAGHLLAEWVWHYYGS